MKILENFRILKAERYTYGGYVVVEIPDKAIYSFNIKHFSVKDARWPMAVLRGDRFTVNGYNGGDNKVLWINSVKAMLKKVEPSKVIAIVDDRWISHLSRPPVCEYINYKLYFNVREVSASELALFVKLMYERNEIPN